MGRDTSEPKFAGWSWARLPARQCTGGFWTTWADPSTPSCGRRNTGHGGPPETDPRQYEALLGVWEEVLFSRHPDWESFEQWHEELRGWETLLADLDLENLL